MCSPAIEPGLGARTAHNLEPLPGRDRGKKDPRKTHSLSTKDKEEMALQDGAFMTITVRVQANTTEVATLPPLPTMLQSLRDGAQSPAFTLH